MATHSSSSTASEHTESIFTPDQNSGARSYGIVVFDDTSIVITSHKLNGDNYLSWSRWMEMFVTGKGKEEYLFITIIFPLETDLKFI